MEKLNKKYGLFTAVCMVVGIVIGSGIFFKSQDVLKVANGSALDSILAWIISGLIMVVIATTFGVMATRYEKVNGVVDYAEATCGTGYAYYVGWFLTTVYYPAMTAVLAWVSANYTLVVAGYSAAPVFFFDGEGALHYNTESSLNSPECITIALLYLILAYFVNAIAPKIAGKFQVSVTIIKLIPIAFIAIVGTIIGLFNGNLVENAATAYEGTGIPTDINTGLFPAMCTTIFAYDGWIVATAINAEIKDSKKNLPIALCLGTVITVLSYTLYNIGILGLADRELIIQEGTSAAFNNAFGGIVSPIINVLVVISCLGTLNGLMIANCRGIYALSARGQGPSPKIFAQVDKETNIPHNAAILSLMLAAVWFVYFIFAGGDFFPWEVVKKYRFDSSELPIITLYALYIPIIISMMVKEKDLKPFRRFVLPILSVIGIGIILTACVIKHMEDLIWYFIVFAIIMFIGWAAQQYNKKRISNTEL